MDISRRVRHMLLTFALLPPLSGVAVQPMMLVKSQAQGGHTGFSISQSSGRVVDCLTIPFSEDGAPNRVEVRQNRVSEGPPYSVYFIAGWPDSPKTVAEYPGAEPSPPDMFFAGANLILEWVAGDRPVIQAFHIVRGGVNLIFERGARAGFEYWGNMILQNNAAIGTDGNYHATTTKLWQWDNKQYKLVATVPYDQRLYVLAKLESEGKSK